MNKLKVNGTQTFMGITIPVIEGGFGKNCRVVSANTVAAIHSSRLDKVNELINNNIDEFEIGVDILDLMKDKKSLNLAKGLGLVSNNRQKHCYLLSEQGYMLLVGFMKTDKSKEIRKKLRREYFAMREIINSDEQKKAKLLLMIYDGGQDAVLASKELTEIEVHNATAPLIAENNHKQEVINGFTEDIDIYDKTSIMNRICKRSYGDYANRYKELYKCFRETFHIDLEARCEGYNLKQIKKKDKLTTIRYAEKFGHTDDLYSCCVKLYETEANEILEELKNIQE